MAAEFELLLDEEGEAGSIEVAFALLLDEFAELRLLSPLPEVMRCPLELEAKELAPTLASCFIANQLMFQLKQTLFAE